MRALVMCLCVVAAAASVTVKGCDDAAGASFKVDYNECFTLSDESSAMLTDPKGTGDNSTATMTMYTSTATCTGLSGTVMITCTCSSTDPFKLNCDTAPSVLPSAFLIVTAIAAHILY